MTGKPDAGQSAPKLRRREWQTDAWDYFDNVGEVKHAVRYVGNAMGKLRVFPAVDVDGVPVPVTDPNSQVPKAVADAAVAELERLRSPRGGQSEILRVLSMNLEVAGEGFIVGFAERTTTIRVEGQDVPVTEPEEWDVRSISEVEGKAGAYKVVDPEDHADRQGRAVTADDTLIRVWQRHPRYASAPDCALGGLLADCEALHTLSLLIIGDSNSKRNNGFLLVPNEITFGSASRNDVGGDEEDGEDDEDQVMRALAETMQGPIADPASPSAVQPTLVRGPAEALKEFRHVLASRPADTIDDKIEGRVKRIARGLDLPVEVVLGLESTTFANAAQVDKDTFDDYLQPRAELLADALSFGFLTPQLMENAATRQWADRIFVWYDPAGLFTQPDPTETASDAHNALVISDAVLRKALGFDEEDAPTEEELLRRTGLKRGIMTGDLTLALLKLLGVDIPMPDPVPPDAPAPAAVNAGGRASPRVDRPGLDGQGEPPRRPAPLNRR